MVSFVGSFKEDRFTTEGAMQKFYRVTLTDEERQELLTFISAMQQRLAAEGHADANLRAWSIACHALFASSRFQILE